MKLPEDILFNLAGLIQGHLVPGQKDPISAPHPIAFIGSFFQRFGGDGLYPPLHSPDSKQYVMQFLRKLNGSPSLDDMITALPTFCTDYATLTLDPNAVAYEVNKLIGPFGVRLRKSGDTFHGFSGADFVLIRTRREQIDAVSLIELNDDTILEHVEKASTKIDNGDFPGAISSSYTLVEGFLKELLRRRSAQFNEAEGNISELYKLVSAELGLNPAGETLESYVRSVLQGLKQQVTGLYELANKASDRHARRYEPARHHAKLAVNAAFTLCEFLLDSYEYQNRQEEKAAS